MELSDGRKSLLISVSAHVLLCILIGFAGWKNYEAQKKADRIYTVDIVSGTGGGGGGGGGKSISANPRQPSPAASVNSLPGFQAPVADAIAEDFKPQQQTQSSSVSAPASPAVTNLNVPQSGTGSGTGTGRGTGTGSGVGSGSGSGTGSGSGSGNGSGTGAGSGPGFDTNAIQPDVSPSFLGGSGAVYPETMRNHGITGRVRVRMVVSKSGGVESASVIASSGYSQLDQAALDAAYTYRFAPATKAGYAVRCYATRTFTFGLR